VFVFIMQMEPQVIFFAEVAATSEVAKELVLLVFNE